MTHAIGDDLADLAPTDSQATVVVRSPTSRAAPSPVRSRYSGGLQQGCLPSRLDTQLLTLTLLTVNQPRQTVGQRVVLLGQYASRGWSRLSLASIPKRSTSPAEASKAPLPADDVPCRLAAAAKGGSSHGYPTVPGALQVGS